MSDIETTLATFVQIKCSELAQAKKDGKYPLARIMFAQDDDDPSITRFIEIISNPEAGWNVKGMNKADKEERILADGTTVWYTRNEVLDDIQHAVWAAVELYYQRRNTIMEHGLHILDVDMSKTPERVIGGIAAWNTNPQWAKYAPEDGWASVKARNVGGGNIHYVKGEQFADGQETKHDYIDMLLSGSANFRLATPSFWSVQKLDEEGHPQDSWISTVIQALTLEREASIAESKVRLNKWRINQDAYQGAATAVRMGKTIKDSALVVMGVDGKELDLNELSGVTLFVYVTIGKNTNLIRTIPWDHSDFAKALVDQFRTLRFSLTRLAL